MNEAVEYFSVGQTAISNVKPTVVAPHTKPCTLTKGLEVKSLPTNTNIIYVGNSDVDVGNGFPLAPGESVLIPVVTGKNVSAIAVVDQERVAWLGV